MWRWDKREKMAAQLIMRGHGSMREIMTANYGTWPPPGLDIAWDKHLDQDVKIINIKEGLDITAPAADGTLKTKLVRAGKYIYERMFVGGRAYSTPDQARVMINGLAAQGGIISTSFSQILMHERRHVEQLNEVFRKEDYYGTCFGKALLGENKPASEKIMDAFMAQHAISTNKRPKGGSLWAHLRMGFSALFGFGPSYHYDGLEIQSRLEEVICHPSVKWGALPLNRDDLQIALYSMGMKLPRSIINRLRALPDFKQKYKLYRKARAARGKESMGDLNTLFKTLPNKGAQRDFLDTVIPQMYGDMLETFGDRLGSARMGFGANKKLPLFLFKDEMDAIYNKKDTPAVHQSLERKIRAFGLKETCQFMITLAERMGTDYNNAIHPAMNVIFQSFLSIPDLFDRFQDETDRRRFEPAIDKFIDAHMQKTQTVNRVIGALKLDTKENLTKEQIGDVLAQLPSHITDYAVNTIISDHAGRFFHKKTIANYYAHWMDRPNIRSDIIFTLEGQRHHMLCMMAHYGVQDGLDKMMGLLQNIDPNGMTAYHDTIRRNTPRKAATADQEIIDLTPDMIIQEGKTPTTKSARPRRPVNLRQLHRTLHQHKK